MARFRIWDHRTREWRDCMDVPMYVLHKDSWLPLLPNQFAVNNQFGDRWEHIDDEIDEEFDDPCAVVESESCNGSPTSLTRGSGDGLGSKGPKYDQLTGYPPGYDLPDAGRSGFGQIFNGAAPTGRSINRPGIRRQESYDPAGLSSRYGLGTYANPNTPYAYTASRGARITETIYAIPKEAGIVEVPFCSYDDYGVSVDIYHMGIRVASTCGPVKGRGRISFEFNRFADDRRIMIRVRSEPFNKWALTIFPPALVTTRDRGNLELDYQTAYDSIRFPDLINERYLGTTVFPAPCHAAVWPRKDRLVDATSLEYYHYVGNVKGKMILDYTSWDNFDYFEVYHGGQRIATTLDAQTELGFLEFEFDATENGITDIMIRVVSDNWGSGANLESNYYSIYCPSSRGARTYRHPCESYTIISAGHTTTEDNFELGQQTDKRAVNIQVRSGSYPTLFEVFDNKMNLLDSENLGAKAQGTLEFWKETHHTDRSKITIRVTSAIGSDWTYWVWCPIQPPVLEHRDLLLTYNCLTIEDEQDTVVDVIPNVIHFAALVDLRCRINFQAVTASGEVWEGKGRNQAWKDGAASVGGVLYKTNETQHGDLSSWIKYAPIKFRDGNFEVEKLEMTTVRSGGTEHFVGPTPTLANNWMTYVELTDYPGGGPNGGEHWVDLKVNMKVTYKKVK